MTDISRLPGPRAEHWEWQMRGACLREDSDLFFYDDRERGAHRQARDAAAKAVCGRCPVLQQCRQHALAVQEPYGTWGGLSPADRDAIIAEDGDAASTHRVDATSGT